jgi:hypothetical protein
MNQKRQPPSPEHLHPDAWMDEPDIGSGEKTPGEHETEAIIRSVPPNRPANEQNGGAGPRQGGDGGPQR